MCRNTFALLMIVLITCFIILNDGVAARISVPSCSQTDIQTAINGAGGGDTISVPAGTCTWTGPITIPDGKTIKLIGAGWTKTIINSSTKMVQMYADDSRLSGFRFNRTASGDTADMVEVRGVRFRIDNNYFDDAGYLGAGHWVIAINANAANETVRPEGVVDSNYLNHCKFVVLGSTNFTRDNGFWASDSVIGTVHSVYFEDNTLDRGDVASVMIDSNYAGSYVVRYNNLVGSNIMAHSLQGPSERGTRSWEIYGNYMTMGTAFNYPVFLRGGTGMVFTNSISFASAYANTTAHMRLDNVRTSAEKTTCCGSGAPNSGPCDGTSLWDGNVGSGNAAGWPCRDQIGRGKDSALFDPSGGNYPASTSEPAYFWFNYNRTGSTSIPVEVVNDSQYHVVGNRDYYNFTATFNGSSGVGCGTLASRPSTCTPGVGYWATNQSCSNLSGMVGKAPTSPISGKLYKCVSANVWSADGDGITYTPYQYPHPLRRLSAPVNLRKSN